jgi:hypothetical protein
MKHVLYLFVVFFGGGAFFVVVVVVIVVVAGADAVAVAHSKKLPTRISLQNLAEGIRSYS